MPITPEKLSENMPEEQIAIREVASVLDTTHAKLEDLQRLIVQSNLQKNQQLG